VRSWSGVTVDESTAQGLAAWWAAVELVAGVGSSLPLDEERVVGEDRIPVPLSTIFADPDPDPSVTSKALRHQILTSAVSRGNAYAELLGTDGSRTPTGMRTIHPDHVQWRYEVVDGIRDWRCYVDGVERPRWPLGNLWHFPLFVQAGCPVGMSPLALHRQTIGAAIAAQKFSAQYFDSGGNPVMVARTRMDPGQDGAKALKQRIVEATRGNREPLVIPQDIELDKWPVTADDAQFIESQRFGVEEIARIVLGGFAEMIGGSTSGSSVTYANTEQRMAAFLALSLIPRYLAPLEESLSTLVPRGRVVRHNVNALLRGDLGARFAAYEASARIYSLTGAPVFLPNEVRALEDLPPLADPAMSGGATTREGGADA
jgi:HK97 family phage portal protein